MLATLQGKRVVIVHGYTASPDANWFPWLAEKLRQDGVSVDVPEMPNPHAPEPRSWASKLQEVFPVASGETFLVGHSLGCIAILRHVLSLPEGSVIGGALLVSGFAKTLETLPMLGAFTHSSVDVDEIKRRVLKRASIFSEDDVIVPPSASEELAAALSSSIVKVNGGGHFLDRDGFLEFPQAYDELKRLIAQ
ncbi:RBBP9/YdeN family alpha/beta hydrolase [Stenotrophomonas sp. PUT21]|uniref:RBBP9/YdeN family alpha/beta hydrolase n=1 Tax=Stenotrophomonas sp. PUT21 TaxID=3456954 RepID=UPI003FCD2F34